MSVLMIIIIIIIVIIIVIIIIIIIIIISEKPSSMGMTPKVNHSRFDFNLMFLTLGIFNTEGT